VVQLIRFIKELLQSDDIDSPTEKIFIEYLNNQTHKSTEVIVFEACKSLCELKNLSNKELSPTISVLSMFLLSTSSVNKFAALKILNKLISNPLRANLITNTEEFENLLSDNNKSLCSMAISLLLKICKDENIEKLLN